MRHPSAVLLAAVLLTNSGCELDSLQAPPLGEVVIAERQSVNLGDLFDAQQMSWSPETCHISEAGFECTPATRDYDHLKADPTALAFSCQHEACPGNISVVGVSVQTDGSIHADVVTLNCYYSGSGTPTTVLFANDNGRECWDCAGNCMGEACPFGPGKEAPGACVNMGVQSGSDCHAFRCPEGSVAELGLQRFITPVCKRPIQPPPPPPPGTVYTAASTVNSRPRMTWSAVANASTYRVYRQLSTEPQFQIAYEITGLAITDLAVKVTGSPLTSPPASAWVRYRVVGVNSVGVEGPFANIHYWSYQSGGGPQ